MAATRPPVRTGPNQAAAHRANPEASGLALPAVKAAPPQHAPPRRFGQIQPVQPMEFHVVNPMPPCLQPAQHTAPTNLQLHRHHQPTILGCACVPAPEPLENSGHPSDSEAVRRLEFAFKPKHGSLRATTHTATLKAFTNFPALGPATWERNTRRTVVTSTTHFGILRQPMGTPTRQPRHQWPANWQPGEPARTFPTESRQAPPATKSVLAP